MRTEDGCIIHECLNGEPEAFGVLVDKYKAGIYAFACAKLGDFRDAQDVTQEVFVQAYRDLRSLRRWESFAFWLYRIAYTHCAQWTRARSKHVDSEFVEDQDPRILDLPSLACYRESSVNESVRDALDALPEIYREALMLRYFGGMNSSEIARALGTSPTAVRKRLSRGRAQLREEMVATMGPAFEGQRLQAGFTFQIVETVKHIKIQPIPRATGLSWGLSIAAGIILTVLSLNPHMSTTSDIAFPAGLLLPAQMKVLETGEIPVDILKISQTSVISSNQGNSDGGGPGSQMQQNAFMLAPNQNEGGTWINMADMPIGGFGMGVSAVKDKIYAIGGLPAPEAGALSTVQEYDPVTNTWAKKADMPTPRSSLSAAVVDGKIYAMGGSGGNQIAIGVVEEYDPVTDTWLGRADMPTARKNLSTAVHNGKIYAFGGDDGGKFLDVVEEYDATADRWTRKGTMPAPNKHFGIGVANGKIYIIGGFDRPNWPFSALSRVDIYDPIKNTWGKGNPMRTPRGALGTGEVSGKIYVLGGWDPKPTFFSTVEEYTPEGWPFSVSTHRKLPTKWGEVKTD